MFIRPRHCLIVHEEPGSGQPQRRSIGQTGYSLIELLVVVALLLVVMGAIYGVWLGLARTYAFTDNDMAGQTQSRAAMMEMVEYIRTARQPPSVEVPEGLQADYEYAIAEASPFSLTLWTDTNRNGSHKLQLVRFRVDPGPDTSQPDTRFQLVREEADETGSFVNSPAVRVVTLDVANDRSHPLFTYMNGLGAETTEPTQIRQIRISLRIDVNPGRSPVVNVLTSLVQPRNLR